MSSSSSTHSSICHDEHVNQLMVIKEIKKPEIQDAISTMNEIKGELNLLLHKQLDHRNDVVTLHGAGFDRKGGKCYIAMEQRLDGGKTLLSQSLG